MKIFSRISADIPNKDFPTINRTELTRLTPSSIILPKNLTVPQLVNYFSAFYGTQRFITVSTRARQLTPFRSRLRQAMPLHLFLKTHFNIIFPSTPMSSKLSFPLMYLYQNHTSPILSPHMCYMPRPSNFFLF